MAVQDEAGQTTTPVVTDAQKSAEPTKTKPAAKTTAAAPEVVIARSTPTKTLTAFEKLVQDATALTKNSSHLSSFIATLQMYLQFMAPGLIVAPADGANYNRSLWMALSYLLENAPAGEFRAIWSVFLGFVAENANGCFSARYAYRFESHFQDDEKCKALHALINLATLTCNPATRAEGLKQVSLEKSLNSPVFSEAARQRLISFYRT